MPKAKTNMVLNLRFSRVYYSTAMTAKGIHLNRSVYVHGREQRVNWDSQERQVVNAGRLPGN
eukprot:12562788-Alexandrium_andersonii.AAC.1